MQVLDDEAQRAIEDDKGKIQSIRNKATPQPKDETPESSESEEERRTEDKEKSKGSQKESRADREKRWREESAEEYRAFLRDCPIHSGPSRRKSRGKR